MGKGSYLQISSMLHFNDNEDEAGAACDSLRKIRPLLNIVKKTLGRYANFDSELSFDEATMACFSRYGCSRISFNLKKPTGKFQFKFYVLYCTRTNLTYKIKIQIKDELDDEPAVTAAANDKFCDEMIN
jgi:hypothetical protein